MNTTKRKCTELKDEHQARYDQLITDCHLFWAFSNEQFNEGREKHPLKEGEKYVSIGMGGYMPKSYFEQFAKGTKELDARYKRELKHAKADEAILYELNNYECFYTGDISDAMPTLEAMGYTVEQVKAVYHANREFALN